VCVRKREHARSQLKSHLFPGGSCNQHFTRPTRVAPSWKAHPLIRTYNRPIGDVVGLVTLTIVPGLRRTRKRSTWLSNPPTGVSFEQSYHSNQIGLLGMWPEWHWAVISTFREVNQELSTLYCEECITIPANGMYHRSASASGHDYAGSCCDVFGARANYRGTRLLR
jgi:hypothetical protein